MPNLTSYTAPPIHLNRELPKTYCDLLRHEIDYNNFLHQRISTIQSSLSYTNKNQLKKTNIRQQRKDLDHNQRLYHVYRNNLQLCRKILRIWSNNNNQQGGIDCHNENYKNHIKISHFCLQQKQRKDNIEHENRRFIRSLIYHRKTYQPVHDRRIAYKAYQHHLKLLRIMSHYPTYNNLKNSHYKTLLDNEFIPEYFDYNYNKIYRSHSNMSLRVQCPSLTLSYKFNKKQKHKTIKTQSNELTTHKQLQTNNYIRNLSQQTINNAIFLYNQPIPSAFNCSKSSDLVNSQKLKTSSDKHRADFRSFSCQQFLEPWHFIQQERVSF